MEVFLCSKSCTVGDKKEMRYIIDILTNVSNYHKKCCQIQSENYSSNNNENKIKIDDIYSSHIRAFTVPKIVLFLILSDKCDYPFIKAFLFNEFNFHVIQIH